MRIKNLLLLGAFLTMSGGAMAQTTITAGNVKFVPGHDAELKFNYTNAQEMGGWQMVVSLPDGVTLEENTKKTQLSIGGSTADATFYNVTVPSGFEVIGVKADAAGTTIDGTTYKAGDVLLVCFPTTAGKTYAAATSEAELCTLNLATSTTTTAEEVAAVKIEGFAGSDKDGSAGKDDVYKTKTAEVAPAASATIHALKCDLSDDGLVDITDLQKEINIIVGTETVSAGVGDFNGDGEVDIADLQLLINEVVL